MSEKISDIKLVFEQAKMDEYQELYKMIPYVVTLIVLVITSMRSKRENQPPASLGLAYFREER